MVTLLVPLAVVMLRPVAGVQPAGLARLVFCCRGTLLVTGHERVTLFPVCVRVRLGRPAVGTTYLFSWGIK